MTERDDDLLDESLDADLRELWKASEHEAPDALVRSRALEASLRASGATPELAESPLATLDHGRVSRSSSDDARGPSVPPPLPPPDLGARSRNRAIRLAIAGIAVAASLTFAFTRDRGKSGHGDITADARTEIDVGGRARAVLEPSSHVTWSAADDVTQTAGSVFYRVEPGSTFRVHTPAGDVAVLGTCFRVKIRDMRDSAKDTRDGAKENPVKVRDLKAGAIGAASTVVAFVAVYEGKVAVSYAGQTVQIVAGQAAETTASGVTKSDDGSGAERAFDDGTSSANDPFGDPTMSANKNLVASVSDYRARLERMEVERRALHQQLADVHARLEAVDAGTKPPRKEISEDEWKELAKNGTIKMNVPCSWKGGWYPSAKQLSDLALAPGDAATLNAASSRLYDRAWAQVEPICEKVGGKDIAEKLGLDGCPNFIFNYLRGADRENTFEQMRHVSEMRAGLRPMLAFDDPTLGPVEKVFLVMTGQQKTIEDDLAQSFGPEEAHRLVTADAFCGWSSTWNGPGPRKPATSPKP